MDKNEIKQIPKGWEVVSLGEIIRISSGKNLTQREMNLGGKFDVYGGNGITGKHDEYNVEEATIVLGRVGYYCGSVHITSPKSWVTDNAFITSFPENLIDKKFLFSLLTYINLGQYSNSTAQPVISGKSIYPVKTLLPPLPEQLRIVDKIEELFTQLDKGVEQLKAVQQQLRTYRQAVLKAAFEGKLTEDWRSAFASDLHSHFGEGGKASADGEKTKVEGSHAGGVPPIGGQGVRAAQAQSAQELLEQIKIERQQHYEQELEQWTTEVEEWEANGKPGKKPRKPRKPKEYPPLTEEELKALPKLPEGWEISRLGNFADIIGGVTKGRKLEGKKTIELPYLRVANVQDGYLDLKVIKTIQVLPDDLEKYRLLEGDVLYTEGGDKDKLGRGTIWKNEIDNCIHQNHVFRARLFKELTLPSFIAYYSQTQEAKTYFFRNAKQTVNLASINMTVLCNLPVPIPPTEEQHQILEEIESRLSVCEQVEKSIEANLQKAEALRQSILKKAFEGKLVPQDPEEEPAGVLLERIRGESASAGA